MIQCISYPFTHGHNNKIYLITSQLTLYHRIAAFESGNRWGYDVIIIQLKFYSLRSIVNMAACGHGLAIVQGDISILKPGGLRRLPLVRGTVQK